MRRADHKGGRRAMIVAHILADKGSDVITIEPRQTLADAARLLAERRIGAVVVADAQHPVQGIISERDIARAVARRGAAALQEPVSRACRKRSTPEKIISEQRVAMPAHPLRRG